MRSNLLAYLALLSSLLSFCSSRWAFHDGEGFAMGVGFLIVGMLAIQSPKEN